MDQSDEKDESNGYNESFVDQQIPLSVSKMADYRQVLPNKIRRKGYKCVPGKP